MRWRPDRPSAALDGAQRAAVSRYSRRVRWMKVLLPVGSVLLVVAIFLAGRRLDEATSLLSAEEIAALSAGLRLEAPRIAGRTDSGEPFILQADWAEPEGPVPDRIALNRPTGELTLADGRLVLGRADTGLLERSAGEMWLRGEVEIETSDGYRFESERIRVLLSSREAESPGEVFGEGPSGSIEAGSMRIVSDDPEAVEAGDSSTARILFNDRVRVVFLPNASESVTTSQSASEIGEE